MQLVILEMLKVSSFGKKIEIFNDDRLHSLGLNASFDTHINLIGQGKMPNANVSFMS